MSSPSPRRLGVLAGLAVLLALTFPVGTMAATGTTPAAAVRGSWTWPVTAPRVILRPYIAPATPYSAGHRGIDLRTEPGAAVYAPASGVVHFAGVVVDRPVLSIEHPGGLISSFEPVVTGLKAGEKVRAGDLVGTVAGPEPRAPRSGHCGAPCLHFGVRRHGRYVSPLLYLGGIPRSVLLPTRPLP